MIFSENIIEESSPELQKKIEVPTGIKNIVFDLGNVLVPISYSLCFEAFAKIDRAGILHTHTDLKNIPLFTQYELGHITTDSFVEQLQQILAAESKLEVVNAWNAMILDLSPSVVPLLYQLKQHYTLYILSNTNSLHRRYFTQAFERLSGGKSLDSVFAHTYYSHHLHLRKPDPNIYTTILQQIGEQPSKILFIDDLPENTAAARQVGIRTITLANGKTLDDIDFLSR